MKLKGPVVTLIAGLLLAGVLYVVNVDLTSDAERNAASNSGAPGANGAASPTASVQAGVAEASPTAGAPPTASQAAPGGPQQAIKSTYAGRVNGGGAAVALVISDGKAIAYICDGRRIEAWLNGTALNGQLSLSGPNGNLAGTFGNGQAVGSVAAGGRQWGFTIKTVAPPSGLYRAAATVRDTFDASWVVFNEGTQQIQVGLRRMPDGSVGPAEPFNTANNTFTVNGVAVPIVPGTPS
jgi:hypothetical protein